MKELCWRMVHRFGLWTNGFTFNWTGY